MRPAYHRCVFELERALLQDLAQPPQPRQEKLRCFADQQRLRRVHDIVRSEAVVQVARLAPDVFGDVGRKGDDVMLHALLDFENPVDVEPAPPADRAGRAFRDQAGVDRKSTRLNSSHGYMSYAVFCLKKKMRGTQASTP